MADLNYIIENIDEAVFRHYGDKNDAGRMLGITNSTRKRNHMDVIFENKILEFSVNEDELELVGIRHIFNLERELPLVTNPPEGIVSFPTIDQCVDYLLGIGCDWDYHKERELHEKSAYKYEDTLVLYDPQGLLEIETPAGK